MPVVIFFVCLDLERKSSLIKRLINEKFEKEIPMASILTLKGIDQAISSLKYINKNTLKYRYVHHIRQFYMNEDSVEPVGEIGNEELIKILWDTGGSFEEIKKKRKNLNNLRSSVNGDFKKLYDKGGNPEGIKIGTGNIFVMLDDEKDKILNEFGCDLQPDGTLKLDQIMDILRLANETVSGSMAVQEKEVGKDGLSKIDQLKGLIKGLSEKVGLSSPEVSETDHKTQGALDGSKEFEKVNDLGEVPDEIAGEGEVEGDLEEVEEVDELEEDEVLEAVDDLEDVSDEIAGEGEVEGDLDEIEDLEEDEIIEEVEDVDLDELAEGPEDSERAGGQDDLKGTGIDSGVDTSGSGEGPDGVGASEKDAGMESQSEDIGDGHVVVGDGVGSEGGMGPDPLIGSKVPEGMEIDDSQEIEEVEDLEEGEVLEVVEDLEEDEILEEVEDVDIDDTIDETGFDGAPGGVGENFDEDNGKNGIKKAEGAKETEEIGLPVDSLGTEYSDELSDKVRKDSLLAEEFDGYLGVMDRYYNHYILIPGGEYIVGSKKPGKDEKSEQLISLSPFYIGRFPVTNGLFQIFIEKTGYKTLAERVGYGKVYYGRFQRKKDETTGLMTSTWNSSLYCETVEGACWYQPCGPGSTLHNKRNHPVVQISLEDATAFAAWTGKRLPSENEWEAASRTTKGWILPWGKEWKKHSCNIENSCTGDTTPVEKYAEFENDFGIADTIGNILEWTLDDVTAMSDNKNRYRYHIAKGGSWISGDDIRLFSRFKIEPESHSNILGFRCVAH